MKRNSILDKIRKVRAKYVDIFVDNSFDLSSRIQYLMDVKGYDQKTLAAKLNKNESEVSKWLSGSHNYTIKTLAKIEDVLGDKLFQVCNNEHQRVKKEVVIMFRDYVYREENNSSTVEISHLKPYRTKIQNNRVLKYQC